MTKMNYSKLNKKAKTSRSYRVYKEKSFSGMRVKDGRLATDAQKQLMTKLDLKFKKNITLKDARLLIFNELERRKEKVDVA